MKDRKQHPNKTKLYYHRVYTLKKFWIHYLEQPQIQHEANPGSVALDSDPTRQCTIANNNKKDVKIYIAMNKMRFKLINPLISTTRNTISCKFLVLVTVDLIKKKV